MPIEIVDHGRDNCVEAPPGLRASLNARITFTGSGNRVDLAEPFVAHSLEVVMGDACRLDLAPGCYAGMLQIHMARAGSVAIGSCSSFNGQTRLLLHEPGRIAIGAGCLFGPDVDVTVSDMHAIFDRATGERVNPARDVDIADEVWIGIGTFVGKGARIGEGAVVGARTFVSGKVRPHTVVAGNPARTVRENVRWRFEL